MLTESFYLNLFIYFYFIYILEVLREQKTITFLEIRKITDSLKINATDFWDKFYLIVY